MKNYILSLIVCVLIWLPILGSYSDDDKNTKCEVQNGYEITVCIFNEKGKRVTADNVYWYVASKRRKLYGGPLKRLDKDGTIWGLKKGGDKTYWIAARGRDKTYKSRYCFRSGYNATSVKPSNKKQIIKLNLRYARACR